MPAKHDARPAEPKPSLLYRERVADLNGFDYEGLYEEVRNLAEEADRDIARLRRSLNKMVDSMDELVNISHDHRHDHSLDRAACLMELLKPNGRVMTNFRDLVREAKAILVVVKSGGA